MTHDVFISYSADDKPIADAMCTNLESNSIRCWIAPRDILPGMDWGSSIIDAIASSRVMVLLLSSHSNNSLQVKREVERAVNKGVTVIPFRIEEVSLSKSLEYQLSLTHWLDALTPPLEKHLQVLASNILQLLSTESNTESTSLQQTTAMPVHLSQTTHRRRVVYLSVGLAMALLLLAGIIWWLGRGQSKPVAIKSVPPLDSLSSISDTQQTKVQETSANNQSQGSYKKDVPNTGVQLRIPVLNEATYDVARELLIREGWQPYKKHWSYGQDPKVQSGNGPIFWKRGYWEVVSCSGSGLAECRFEFIDPSKRVLVVITSGEEAENGEYHAVVTQAVLEQN
jgi:hypothetical protein